MAENVRFNNQSSIILDRIGKEVVEGAERKFILVMHQSRYYKFNVPQEKKDNRVAVEKQVQDLRESFLDLLTRRKYRILTCVYAVFRATDNVMLVLIILTAIVGSEVHFEDLHQAHVLGVFSVDIFNSYLEMETKFWLLHRIQPYIGLALYVTYASFLWDLLVEHPLIATLLIVRCIAFLLELVVDYALDLEIHYDYCNNGWTTNRAWLSGSQLRPVLHQQMISDTYEWSQCSWIMTKCRYTKDDSNEYYKIAETDTAKAKLLTTPVGDEASKIPQIPANYPWIHVLFVWGFGFLCLLPFILYFGAVGMLIIALFFIFDYFIGGALDPYIFPL
jgi:hypothetical protein